ncbi:sel1 repeat family protein [Paracidovorax citrulli]|nr:sel1 repeat family protein [Paracidovorax citrulli]UMT96758.1 sel1 repeat family protein [Paracidovorax citrulli]
MTAQAAAQERQSRPFHRARPLQAAPPRQRHPHRTHMAPGPSSPADHRRTPAERTEAVRWLAQAADGGSALAAVRLGAMYERGGDGEPRQLSAAENWYLRAARQGDAAGLYSLGALYARGSDTVVQRPITACMLMELAARAHAGSGRDDVLLPAGHSALAARAAQTRLAGALGALGAQDAAEAQRRADAWKPGQPLDL